MQKVVQLKQLDAEFVFEITFIYMYLLYLLSHLIAVPNDRYNKNVVSQRSNTKCSQHTMNRNDFLLCFC